MSGLIENIHESLKVSSRDWNWEFAYTPKPGQKRIKITAVSRRNPGQRKVLVLAEDLFRKVPLPNLAQNIVRLLPALPESETGEPPTPARDIMQPMSPVKKVWSAREHYKHMRQGYQDTVCRLRARSACRRKLDWLDGFSRILQRIVGQFYRKAF